MNSNIIWTNFITNKKIIFIGPADYTLEHKRGTFIDSFDSVARCNHSIPILPYHYDSLGKRTDLYYNNLHVHHGKNKLDPFLLKASNIQLIISPYPNIYPFSIDIQRFCFRKEGGTIPLRIVSETCFHYLLKKLSTRPNTGIIALYDLLLEPIDFLFVSGFTFFTSGTTYSKNAYVSESIHEQSNQKEFVRQLILQYNETFIVDQHMRILLWTNEHQWLQQGCKILQSHTSDIHKYFNFLDSQKQYLFTWNPFQQVFIYEYSQENWNFIDSIDGTQIEIPNIWIQFINQTIQSNIPNWFYTWSLFQFYIYSNFLLPIIQNPNDALIPVFWLWNHTPNIDTLFEKSLSIQKIHHSYPIYLYNQSFWYLMDCMYQTRWIHTEQSYLKLRSIQEFINKNN